MFCWGWQFYRVYVVDIYIYIDLTVTCMNWNFRIKVRLGGNVLNG